MLCSVYTHEVLISYCQLHRLLVVDFYFNGYTDKMDKDKERTLKRKECREVVIK